MRGGRLREVVAKGGSTVMIMIKKFNSKIIADGLNYNVITFVKL